jgi:protein required for attachment to host cells
LSPVNARAELARSIVVATMFRTRGVLRMTQRYPGQGHWLVVANGARARILADTGTAGVFRHVADLVHPQTRQKGVELAQARGGDRPGHVEGTGHGPGGAAYQPRTDPREREHDRFAREVAEAVNRGVAAGDCQALTLVASNPALGEIKSHLSHEAQQRLQRTIAHDYTDLREDELAQRLASGGDTSG